MCGILLVASPVHAQHKETQHLVEQHAAACEPALRSRGPDHYGQQQITVSCGNASITTQQASTAAPDCPPDHDSSSGQLLLHLAASLLQLRGAAPSTSPLTDTYGNILCFNGEIFGGLDMPPGSNDGKYLAAALGAGATVHDVVDVLSRLRGPWSLVYWQEKKRLLWFARDWLGKRSLLLKRCEHHASSSSSSICCLVLSSVSPLAQGQQQNAAIAAAAAADSLARDVASSQLGDGAVGSSADSSRSSSSNSCDCMQEGSWIEVPPGIYSISADDLFTSLTCSSSSSSSSSNTASRDPNNPSSNASSSGSSNDGGHVSAVEPAASNADADVPANVGISTAADLCEIVQGLIYHPYSDQQLLKLQQYDRAQQLITPAATANEAVMANGELQQQQQQQEGGKGQQVPQQQQQRQGDPAQGVSHALQEASRQLLQLLQAAVDVRCLTINTLQQQQQPPGNGRHSERVSTVAAAEQQQQQQAVQLNRDRSNTVQQMSAAVIGLEPPEQQSTKAINAQSSPSQHGPSGAAAAQPPPPAAAAAAICVAPDNAAQQLPPAPVLILFSGGVDSTLIAALAHLALPPDIPIDLSNVCFVQGNSPDRIAARSALLELAAFAPNRQWRLIEVDSTLQEVDQLSDRIRKLLHPAGTLMDLNIGAALWLATRAEGRVVVPVRVEAVSNGSEPAADGNHSHSSSSIRASLDTLSQDAGSSNSTVAPAAAKNATSAGATNSSSSSSSSSKGDQQDQWTLVPVGPSRQPDPMPAAAAANSAQQSSSSSSSSNGSYRSAARVVLLGHGADEQCAGYGRHRTKFRFNGGWQALSDELALDVKRLWIRNLGRDDRLIADHGREGRHPFLDENLMSALLDTPLPMIADLTKSVGVGDKQVLRQALASLGITAAAAREKRAIQFGTRIGKLSNQREFGSNRKANMLSAGQIKIATLQRGQDT